LIAGFFWYDTTGVRPKRITPATLQSVVKYFFGRKNNADP